MDKTKVVLVVVAHADDMEFMAGGTVARFVKEKNYDVHEYIVTDNSKGSYRLSREQLIEVSANEAAQAGEVLGLAQVRFEGYPDGELEREAPAGLRGKIMAMIREVKADIVMSWDPFAPYEEHPDHRAVAMATLEAANFAGMPLFYPEHEHPPHTVTEAYWFAKNPWNADLFVDITGTIDLKIEALLKHDCQMMMTVDALAREAETAGIQLPALEQMGPRGHLELVAMGVRQFCATTGERPGFEYAERFRYEKLGMLDSLMGLETVTPDF